MKKFFIIMDEMQLRLLFVTMSLRGLCYDFIFTTTITPTNIPSPLQHQNFMFNLMMQLQSMMLLLLLFIFILVRMSTDIAMFQIVFWYIVRIMANQSMSLFLFFSALHINIMYIECDSYFI